MTTITRLNCAHYRIPLDPPLSDSTHGLMTHFELVTVRLTDSDGVEGVGYTYAVNHGGSAIRALIADDLADLMIGEDPDRIAHLWDKMWWAVHYPGRGGLASFAFAAIDTALWDRAGKARGMPLWKMLGGHDPKVMAYVGGIDLELPLPELLSQTDNNLAKGFKAVKMKVGRDHLHEDVARVAAMREHLGEGFPLMADANMRWSRDQAKAAFRALEPYGLTWLEEPMIPDDEVGHARLAALSSTPIATGENFHTIYEFERMIRVGGVTFPEPDVSNCGGITPWMKIATLAEANNLRVTSHGVHDIHVHLLAAIPNKSYVEWHGFGLEHFFETPSLSLDEQGRATAPDRPGHGVAFDWQKLATHAR
ncbi:MAG: mandelate racemase/muconate lactonizing enzyme family protein [Alphaproteobacteria bacterium]|jgi:L-alanine-DL-glutamate epimerase-like enolase superfamily enzyme